MKLPPALYAGVTFLSAFLLFLLEPIAARRLLPVFGGSSAVWITCLVFFQCALLLGYLYAHLLVSRLTPRAQAAGHIALLGVAALSLGVRVHPAETTVTWHPVGALLWMLTATIGLPFLALAATSPLLQAWQAKASVARLPPWWQFSLSNGGSLLALILYPAIFEADLALHSQAVTWGVAFCAFALLCGALAWRQREAVRGEARNVANALAATGCPWMLWLLLPGCASMLLCAVTNHLGENVAAIPLLWIVPLAAYLLSFVVAFASPRAWPRFISVRMLALTLAVFAYLLYTSRTALPLAVSIPVYTGALFFACLFCHAELNRLRPSSPELTGFYLRISLGSAIGAILVGLVSPNIFRSNHDLAITTIVLAAAALATTWQSGWAARAIWSAAAVGLVYIAFAQAAAMDEDAIAELRSFYGSLRVTETHLPPAAETTRTLFHGRIQHGTQLFGNGFRTQPSSYYGHSSGVGLVLDLCCGDRPRRIGVVGLGTGTIAAYGRPGDDITFYEINPLVERLARALFTYLHDSPARMDVKLGDARLSLDRESSSPPYDVLVLDAFSGDAIPIHLLTAEAIALYRRRLRPDGTIVFHISSQYVDLAPQLALQARNAGLQAALVHSEGDEARGLFAADWLLMSADSELLLRPEIANASQPLREIAGLRLWTDDYSSLLPLLKWSTIGRQSNAYPRVPQPSFSPAIH